MDMPAVRQPLETEQTRLQGVLDAAGRGQARGGRQAHQLPAEQAAETLIESWTCWSSCGVRTELAEVEVALHRLDIGRYGLCEVCGGEIAEARLEAMPATRYCVADQARAERDARLRAGR